MATEYTTNDISVRERRQREGRDEGKGKEMEPDRDRDGGGRSQELEKRHSNGKIEIERWRDRERKKKKAGTSGEERWRNVAGRWEVGKEIEQQRGRALIHTWGAGDPPSQAMGFGRKWKGQGRRVINRQVDFLGTDPHSLLGPTAWRCHQATPLKVTVTLTTPICVCAHTLTCLTPSVLIHGPYLSSMSNSHTFLVTQKLTQPVPSVSWGHPLCCTEKHTAHQHPLSSSELHRAGTQPFPMCPAHALPGETPLPTFHHELTQTQSLVPAGPALHRHSSGTERP
jgi:hypothetical protein